MKIMISSALLVYQDFGLSLSGQDNASVSLGSYCLSHSIIVKAEMTGALPSFFIQA